MKPIDPTWRTSDVVALCQSMREANDYGALPILADALQDANCDDEELLALLRGVPPAHQDAERVVAVVMSAETADAVAWLEAFAERLGDSYGYRDDEELGGTPSQPMNYGVLMEAAREHNETGETMTQYGSQEWQDEMDGETRVEFWKQYQLVTGKGLSDKKDRWGYSPNGRLFSCSC